MGASLVASDCALGESRCHFDPLLTEMTGGKYCSRYTIGTSCGGETYSCNECGKRFKLSKTHFGVSYYTNKLSEPRPISYWPKR